MSLPFYQQSVGNSELSQTVLHRSTASTQVLLDRVYEICEQDLSYYSPDVVNIAKSNRCYGVLFELLCEKKEQMALPADDRICQPERHAQLHRIDSMLKECMGHADTSWDEGDKEDRNELDQTDQRYHELLTTARTDFAQFTQHLQAKSIERSQEIVQILQAQQYFRPITQADIERCRHEIAMKFASYQNQLKQLTCQNVMMLRAKYLDAKRKRRNFSKEATRILSEFFHSHIDHPYPSEDAKVELARRCNITVNQVSNWFGNKRIRYKKNQGRVTEGNNGKLGDAFSEPRNLCTGKRRSTSGSASDVSNLSMEYQQPALNEEQYFEYANADQPSSAQSVEDASSFADHNQFLRGIMQC